MAFDRDSFIAGVIIGRRLRGKQQNSSLQIKITQLPNYGYTNGENLSFDGIQVKLYNKDGTIYTDSRYRNGVIPVNELMFPVTVARYDASSPLPLHENIYIGGQLVANSLYWENRTNLDTEYDQKIYHDPVAQVYQEGYGYGGWYIFYNHIPFKVTYKGNGTFFTVTDPGDNEWYRTAEKTTNTSWSSYSSTWNTGTARQQTCTFIGKRAIYQEMHYYRGIFTESYVPESSIVNHKFAGWVMMFGEFTSVQKIPVIWVPPVEGPNYSILSTSYEICVLNEVQS